MSNTPTIPFVGRDTDHAEIVLTVDRAAQSDAIDCHRGQATDNPVLRHRLELMTDPPPADAADIAATPGSSWARASHGARRAGSAR